MSTDSATQGDTTECTPSVRYHLKSEPNKRHTAAMCNNNEASDHKILS